jgi:DNA repair exonuclease SbcCD nuclease subunit
MKFLVFSDTHLHNWQYGANYSNGWNSRLRAQAYVLGQMVDYCFNNHIEDVFFCGDLFHTHGKVDAACLQVASTLFSKLDSFGIRSVTLVGNHDIADKAGVINSLAWLRGYKFNILVDEPYIYPGKFKFVALSYTENKETLQKFLSDVPPDHFVFMHQGVSGVPVGSDFVIPNEILTPDMIPSHVKHAFTGHYHTHKKVSDKLTIVGAPMQHTWADCGEDRGWLVVDSETGEYERVLSKAPRFVKTGPFEINEGIEGNYIRVEYFVEPSDQEDSRKRLLQKGALSVEFSYSNPEAPRIRSIQSDGDFNLNTVIDKFQKTRGLDAKAIKIGEQLRQGTYETIKPNSA